MPINDFSGEYRFTLDAKKRINIPSGIRKMLPPESEGSLVFTRGFEGCVYVFPNDEWKRLTHKLNTLDSFNVKVRDFVRMFVGLKNSNGGPGPRSIAGLCIGNGQYRKRYLTSRISEQMGIMESPGLGKIY